MEEKTKKETKTKQKQKQEQKTKNKNKQKTNKQKTKQKQKIDANIKRIIQQTYKTNRQDKDGTRKKERTLFIIWDKVLFILIPELFYRLHAFIFFL